MYCQNEFDINNNLTNVTDGFKKGNIFENLYNPYKKNIYNFVPKNERQKMLIDVMQYCFYAHELSLYLDTHPYDKEKISLYNKYSDKALELKNRYYKNYEPIMLNEIKEIPSEWVESPWPWEGV